jgi:hypothetical protein
MDTAQYLGIALIFLITICFFLTWFFWQRARHRELMLMIEKGMDPSSHMNTTAKTLRRVALIIIGIGAGGTLYTIIYGLGFRGINSEGGLLATFGLCIGGALLYATRSDQTKSE